MAKVYLGRQEGAAGFERIVAIKCCHESLRSNESFVEMFLNEARLAARIRHPNVVATLDVSDGNPLYLVMATRPRAVAIERGELRDAFRRGEKAAEARVEHSTGPT